MKIPYTASTGVQRSLNPLFKNQHAFICCLHFYEKYLNCQVGINKIINK